MKNGKRKKKRSGAILQSSQQSLFLSSTCSKEYRSTDRTQNLTNEDHLLQGMQSKHSQTVKEIQTEKFHMKFLETARLVSLSQSWPCCPPICCYIVISICIEFFVKFTLDQIWSLLAEGMLIIILIFKKRLELKQHSCIYYVQDMGTDQFFSVVVYVNSEHASSTSSLYL